MNERRTFACPSCSVVLPAGPETPATCPRCRLLLRGPVAAELETVDIELARLGRRSSELLARRVALLAQLRPAPVGAAASSPWAAPAGAGPRTTPAPVPVPAPAPVPVQTTLLTLGALLLSVAGTIFTVLTWGHLGVAGRAGVLVLGTGVAAGTSALLYRRDLRASADAVAVLTLVLGALDLHAARLLVAPDGPVLSWWSGASALLAVVGAATATRLRLPALLTVASGVGQLVLPLAALAALGTADGGDLRGALAVLAVALAGSAALDVALRQGAVTASTAADVPAWARPALRTLQLAAVAALALAGALAAGAALVVDTSGQAVPGATALLVVTAGWILMALLTRSAGATVAAGAAAGSALLAATALLLPAVLDGGAARLEAGLLVPAGLATVLLVAVPLLPARVRTGPRVVGSAAVCLSLLPVLGRVLEVAGAMAAQLARPWPDLVPTSTADVLRAAGVDAPHATLLALLVVAAVAATLGGRDLDAETERAARGAAAGIAAAATLLVPAAIALPLPLAVVATLVPAAALVAPILLDRVVSASRSVPLLALATPFGAAAIAWAAAEVFLSLFTLGVLAILCAAVSWRRDDGSDPIAATTGTLAALLGLSLVPVTALAAGVAATAAGALLAAAGAVVVLATDRPSPNPARAGVLGAAVTAIVLGTAFCAPDPGLLSLVLAGLAAAALALTLRPERAAAAVLSGGLATAAIWVRLADAGVTLPEAYTLPPALLALVVGETVRRRHPDVDPSLLLSPGLVLGLVPTLLISLAEADATRAALLSVAATAVVVTGAAARLRAPLVIGGLVLATIALRQLAPLAAVAPRWVLLGGLGLILLTLGVRYERARADLGRLRRSFAQLD